MLDDYIKDETDYIVRYKYKKKDVEDDKNVIDAVADEEVVCETIKCENPIYKEKIIKVTNINKFRYVISIIIILVLSIMIYTFYSLKKE